ncbi:MAG: hypothetical protein DMG59_26965, partial [Acidobacteria bacterium]
MMCISRKPWAPAFGLPSPVFFLIMMNRRDVFRSAAAFTAASYSRVMGANDRVHLGLVGCGDRGTRVMGQCQKNTA